ncbi:hypothetical protein PLICRDRAFT_178063 [Plicaturopsis crispa FD-325 SS-3]|nr:hypothetical protein PLICRDRAFT_178063 [Plicaturopsis crispa FD-325 SS-3]
MFVFSLVVIVYLPRVAARPQRRPTPRTLARDVFYVLYLSSHRSTTLTSARAPTRSPSTHHNPQAAPETPAIATTSPLR